MKIAYFDCFCGAAGDMIVAALQDAGVDEDTLIRFLADLGLDGYSLRFEQARRHGLAARRFIVTLDESRPQPHRHLHHVVRILEAAAMPARVRERAIRVFRSLAEAEAEVHGTTVDKVHFHEVGAVDAILDVTAAAFCLEHLGIERVVCSPIPTGHGMIQCAHGQMPVPAPATARLLRGVPLAAADISAELTTPTGAAVLTTLAESFGPPPAMTLTAVGCGCGAKDFPQRPNVLRVLIGETTGEGGSDQVAILQTNLDDAAPQTVAYAMERLLQAGALDVYTVPIHMKKGRAGVMLAVLCEPHCVDRMEAVIFRETPSFGVRRFLASRSTMQRSHETVSTPFGSIRVKIGRWRDVVTVSPEYEDCRRAAEAAGVALRTVMDAARAAWGQASTG